MNKLKTISLLPRNVEEDYSCRSPKSREKRERRWAISHEPRPESHDTEKNDTEGKEDDPNISGEGIPIQNGSALGTVWDGVMGMGYPMVGMNVLMDPNIMSMNNYGMVPSVVPPEANTLISDTTSMMMNPVKAIIHCKSCTLFPPNPGAPPPTTRERPPGCRTVFVGGLPENVTEEIISEVFERCGEITTLRLSKKNFCHIRFLYEASVDAAIFLSGYRIRIGSNTDPPNTGRLHVDYAQARDDQYEWECRQRQLQREQRHRERMEEERLRPPSPPPVVHYSVHEAATVHEKIKQEETFTKAIQIVITWLERGDCNKHNVNNFYSMIQSTNSHVRRLLNEKTSYEDEMKKAKEILKGRIQGILLQFSHIERLFTAACHKKVWDHFTKAQRKNIEVWKKLSMEIKNVQLDEPQNEKGDDEMDVSDEDESPKKKRELSLEDRSLKEENESLRCQVEAYKNEVEVLKADYKKDMKAKDEQLKVLQQTLQGMQQQLLDSKKKHIDEELKIKELHNRLKNSDARHRQSLEREIINLDDSEGEQSERACMTESASDNHPPKLTDRDAKLIGIISAFLTVHPFGAGLDYIWSYVSKIQAECRPSEIELLLNKFPAVFKQELVGIGANIERRWMFIAFTNTHQSNNSDPYL